MSNVTIALKAEGVSQVLEALKSIKTATIESEKASVAATQAASKQRIAIYKSEADQRAAILKSEIKIEEELAKASGRSGGGSRNIRGSNLGSETGAGRGSHYKEGDSAEGASAGAAMGASFALMTGAINLASAALKQFSGFVINDVIKPMMEIQTKSVQVANNSGGTVTAKQAQGAVMAAHLLHNVSTTDLLTGQKNFQVRTGQAKLGIEMMDPVATLAKSRGMSVDKAFDLAATLYTNGDKKGDVEKKMLKMFGQSDQGTISLEEMSELAPKLKGAGSKFHGSDVDRLATASALLQTAKPQIGTAEKSMEAVLGLSREGVSAAKKMGLKKDIYTDKSGVQTIEDPAKLIADTYRHFKGKLDKKTLGGVGFTETSQSLLGAYSDTYQHGFDTSKAAGASDKDAKEAGAKAIEDFINGLKNANTTMDEEKKKEADVLNTSGEIFASAMEKMKASLMTPEIEEALHRFAESFSAIEITPFSVAIEAAIDSLYLLAEMTASASEAYKDSTTYYAEGDLVGKTRNKGQDTDFSRLDQRVTDKVSYYIQNAQGEIEKRIGTFDQKHAGPGEMQNINGHKVWHSYTETEEKEHAYAPPKSQEEADEITKKEEEKERRRLVLLAAQEQINKKPYGPPTENGTAPTVQAPEMPVFTKISDSMNAVAKAQAEHAKAQATHTTALNANTTALNKRNASGTFADHK